MSLLKSIVKYRVNDKFSYVYCIDFKLFLKISS